MKNLLGNSCAKGCLIYFVALLAVVALTSLGLGNLGARFGASSQKPQVSALNVPGAQQPAQPAQSGAAPSGPVASGDVGSRITMNTPAPAQPAPTTIPVAPAPPAASGGAAQAPVQSGSISGEAVQPFYIVQPGDTLWGIATNYGVAVDALRSANGTSDDIIKPGDLVYLPQIGTSTAPPPVQPAEPAQPAQPSNPQPGGVIPSMPQTGVNKEP